MDSRRGNAPLLDRAIDDPGVQAVQVAVGLLLRVVGLHPQVDRPRGDSVNALPQVSLGCPNHA